MISAQQRKGMIEPSYSLFSISTQCQLLSVSKSSFYYTSTGESGENLAIMRKLDEEYFSTPFYGALRLTAMLRLAGYKVNIKRVRRLMKLVNWQTIYREPRTTISDKTHYKFPYLLQGFKDRKMQPGLGYGYYIYPDEKRIYVFDSHYRLA